MTPTTQPQDAAAPGEPTVECPVCEGTGSDEFYPHLACAACLGSGERRSAPPAGVQATSQAAGVPSVDAVQNNEWSHACPGAGRLLLIPHCEMCDRCGKEPE